MDSANLFFDLDGTLLDPRPRYKRLHEVALDPHPVTLPFEVYWQLKQDGVSEEAILQQHYPEVPPADVIRYVQTRLRLVETREMLLHDTLFPRAFDLVVKLLEDREVSVVTMRKQAGLLHEEVTRLGLDVLTRVLTADPGAAPWETKAVLMTPYAKVGDWMIGDTEADIRGGQLLGLRTVAVLSGIRNRQQLAALNPDFIVQSIEDLPELLAGKS